MTMAESVDPNSSGGLRNASRKSRRTLILIAGIAIAPIAGSYAAYYLFRHDAHLNYGALLPTVPAPQIDGTRGDGSKFALSELRGRWAIVIAGSPRCDAACEALLYATRQARTMQGKEQERIVRVLVVAPDAPPDAAVLGEHPGLIVVKSDAAATLASPGMSATLIDPLGNQVLGYGEPADIKGIARDLSRLLKASRIG